MSTRRLAMIKKVPAEIRRIFHKSDVPPTPEGRLWRERAARMTLDALGYTNLTVKPQEHNAAVIYARRWFRNMYENHPDPKQVDSAVATFDYANVDFVSVKRLVLATTPKLYTLDEDEDGS